MQDTYYSDKLYPLQDEILRIVESVNSIFYMTGGTVLSRAYLHHRYSDDLDFFVNQKSDFLKEVWPNFGRAGKKI
ncbi:MAG: nucleotidyl transferase AbiEii/AbiGii toxin family protein [Bacteroidetes bacterium]|nr:nucleotidyl transferase AbiEii/AbiGii toxin family protein [Bacteroidota bacterium]